MLRKTLAAIGLCIAYLGFAVAAVGNSPISGADAFVADDVGSGRQRLVVVAVNASASLAAK